MAQFRELSGIQAFMPYGISIDSEQCVWVASKGGLFRLSPDGSDVLLEEKNNNRKQVSPFPKVGIAVDGTGTFKAISCFGDSRSPISQFSTHDISGQRLTTSCYDGRITDMCVTPEGATYSTTQHNFRKSEILTSNIRALDIQDSLVVSTDFDYQRICALPEGKIAVSVVSFPVNPYSTQEIQILKASGKVERSFGTQGQEDGEIFWARAIQLTPDNHSIAILDKTGRIQKFSIATGELEGVLGKIAANTGNGFCFMNSTKILVTCSGIVQDESGEGYTTGDWIELIDVESH